MSWFSKAFGAVLDGIAAVMTALFRAEVRDDRVVLAWTEDAAMGPITDDAPQAYDQAVRRTQPMWEQARAQLDSLQKVDPNFSEAAFLQLATRAYTTAFDAESVMDADAAAGVATPEFVADLRQRIAGWNAQGERRVGAQLKLDGGRVLKVSIDADKQRITVRFTGTAVRYTEDSSSGTAIEGSRTADSFSEFAAYARPAGSTTPKAVAAGAPAHCPACGAPATEGAIYCAFCGTPITGTGGVWLLERISQSAYT